MTTLDQYRLYTREDYVSEADLLASIRRTRPPTPEMARGSAFDSIMEDPGRYRASDGSYLCEGVAFPADVIVPCLAILALTPGGIFQVKTTKDYIVDGEPVTVVGKADRIIGTVVRDTKTCGSSFDADGYADSCQWRFYCDIFQASAFVYDVFLLHERAAGLVFAGYHELPLYPYPALGQDCQSLVTDFVRYARLRHLEQYLQPRAA